MSSTLPGRHRAPSSVSLKPLARGSAALVASGGLVVSMSGGVSATPAPAQPAAKPTAPVTLPAAPVTLPTAPVTTPAAPVVLPTTPSSWSNVRWGSRGGYVKDIQRIAGSYPDGIFGPITHAAVKRWQSDHDLVPDGIVGPITSAAMGLRETDSDSDDRGSSSASRSSERSTAPSSSGSSSTSGVLAYAEQYTGIMYQWGGTSPSTGFDCSGYTSYVFDKVGIDLPRSAEAQRQFATPVSSPQPGDLVFYGAPAYHVAIYAGDGMIYDSGRPGLPTQKRNMFSGVTSFGRVG